MRKIDVYCNHYTISDVSAINPLRKNRFLLYTTTIVLRQTLNHKHVIFNQKPNEVDQEHH